MQKETYKKFLSENFKDAPGLMTINEWLSIRHKKAIYFINKLLANGVSLDTININDWHVNLKPSVYVGIRRYSRLAKNDYKLALKYLKKI